MVYDKLTKTYLCSVPESCFDDGTVKKYKNDTATVNFTFLPIIELTGEFSNDYAEGYVSVIMPDTSETKLNLSANIKWRGGVTNADHAHKRNYHVKFIDSDGNKKNRRFFGLRKDNSWLLEACQIDRSRVRNRVGTDLWNDFVSKPYYYNSEPKAITGTRGQFVELFLNGEYRGIYTMMEPIDRAQLNLKKYDDELTIHGQLWKTNSYEYTAFWNYSDYDNNKGEWGGFETKYPEIEDVSPTDYSTLYNAISFCCNSTDEEFNKDFSKYFDIDPVIDYFIIEHVLWAIDNNAGKNMYWACYDSKADKKITPIMWDLDCTVGQFPSRTEPHKGMEDAQVMDTLFSTNYFYRAWFLNPDGYRDTLLHRYNEARKTILSTDSILARYQKYIDMLEKSGAYYRDSKKWSGDSDIGCDTLDYKKEAEYIYMWVKTHMDIVDKYIFPYPTGIETIYSNAIRDDKIYDLSGRRIGGNKLKRGLYIMNGRKIIKTK